MLGVRNHTLVFLGDMDAAPIHGGITAKAFVRVPFSRDSFSDVGSKNGTGAHLTTPIGIPLSLESRRLLQCLHKVGTN